MTSKIDQQDRPASYRSAGDTESARLEPLEEDTAKLAELRAALVQGEDSGPAEPFDIEGFLAAKRR